MFKLSPVIFRFYMRFLFVVMIVGFIGAVILNSGRWFEVAACAATASLFFRERE
jgi:hypothetical protein